MARKGQAAIQDSLETNEEFENYITLHENVLICMEVYSEFCGPCLATLFAIRKGKLEIGGEKIAMAKALADKIDALIRFKDKSEPVFLFISGHMLIRAVFGANGIELCRVMEEELSILEKEKAGTAPMRRRYEITEHLPEEQVKHEAYKKAEEEYRENAERLRVLTLAARKKRVNERLSKYLTRMNFIMFWPHCHQAHYDLYEKWDNINVQIGAKDTFQITPEMAKEALYMSDVDPNEACLYALMKGEVLVVLFKMFETDSRDFIKLMRHALYEDIPVPKEDAPPEKQLPPIPAYERYASISKTARQVRRERYNAKLAQLAKEKEEADRLAAEQARLKREAEEEALRVEKQRQEEEKMARIAAGLPAEPEPEPVPEGEEVEGEHVEGEEEPVAEEEAVEEPEAPPEEEKVEEVFNSDEEIEGEEFIPPGGLFVPGLYSPPNELAKANALALFYPKQVITITQKPLESECLPPHVLVMFMIDKRHEILEVMKQYPKEILHQVITITQKPLESECLPPHVLVMFMIDKRHEILEVMKQYPKEILHIGIFVGEDPYNAEHVAFTIKQYDKMTRLYKYKDRLAVMVSRKRSLPLLQLAGFNPIYISADVTSGERECLALFPVGYGDEYEEIETVVEEEIEVVEPRHSVHVTLSTPQVEVKKEENEDEEED